MSVKIKKVNRLISFEGVICRKRYLINICIVLMLAMVVSVILAMPMRVPKVVMSLFYLASVAAAVVTILSNHMRRFRDIRGGAHSEFTWTSLLLVSLLIPIANILTLIFLVFKEGAVTGQAKPMFAQDLEGIAANKVDSVVDGVAVSIHNRGKKVSSANEIEKLHELKEKGILTEEEFNKKKEELLKGA